MKLNSLKAVALAAMLMGVSFGAQSQTKGGGCYGPGCNKEGDLTAAHVEGRHCYQAITNWQYRAGVLSAGDRLKPRYSRPSYNCFATYVQGYHTGQYLTSWVQPSLAEYEAWGLALDDFLSNNFVMFYNEPVKLGETDETAYVGARAAADANRALIKEGIDYLMAQNPMYLSLPAAKSGSGDSGTVDLCSADQLEATKGIKNKIIRDGALARLAAGCKGADAQQAKIAADNAAKLAKAKAYRLPTLADLQPIFRVTPKAGQPAVGNAMPPFKVASLTDSMIGKFFATPDLSFKVVGSPEAKVTKYYVLDMGDYRSRLFLATEWPMVRDGQLKLQISPTSVISGDKRANAALLATARPFELINNWLNNRIWEPTAKMGTSATAQLVTAAHTEAVAKIDATLTELAVPSLPFFRLVHVDGRVGSAGRGLSNDSSAELAMGITNPRIYTQDQVNYLSKFEFDLGGGRTAYRLTTPLDEKVGPSSLPDYTNAREVCGADGECWKAPTAKKRGFFD